MLHRFGIRFKLVETDEWYAKIWRERGRGSETCFTRSSTLRSLGATYCPWRRADG
jgi:hypothetical protein